MTDLGKNPHNFSIQHILCYPLTVVRTLISGDENGNGIELTDTERPTLNGGEEGEGITFTLEREKEKVKKKTVIEKYCVEMLGERPVTKWCERERYVLNLITNMVYDGFNMEDLDTVTKVTRTITQYETYYTDETEELDMTDGVKKITIPNVMRIMTGTVPTLTVGDTNE